jgi:hypothetical protein
LNDRCKAPVNFFSTEHAGGKGEANQIETWVLKIYYSSEGLCKNEGLSSPIKACGSLFEPALQPVVPMDKGLLHFSNTAANTEEENHHSSSLAAARERLL